jgi:predicted RNA-binding Zn-ribbon protein involved in translation (DUF1610 family)
MGEITVKKDKTKAANILFYNDMVLFECPFCGMNLIKTNYVKIRKLLDNKGAPRGKICSQCGGTVVLQVDDKQKEIIRSKTPWGDESSD